MNESYVGEGLREVDAGQVVVATKFSQPLKTKCLERCSEESERKLGGRVDMYLLHWPYPFLWKLQWRKMEKLYHDGRCRMIGVCNFKAKHLKRLLAFCSVRPVVNQIERHPMYQQREIVAFCREHGIRIMSYSPLARMDDMLMRNPVLSRIAESHGKTVPQVVIRWNIDSGHIPIPASRTERHILGNFDVFDFSLSREEIDQIDALESGGRIRFDPDTRFGWKDKLRFLLCRLKLTGRRI
jgi:diketogulonate reductase-like aldo/keto reductase